MSPSAIPAGMRIRREVAGISGRPASTVKAARVRKRDELNWLRVDDDLSRRNVGDRLWRRLLNLLQRGFFSHLCRGWGKRRVRSAGADVTSRRDLLVI